MTIQDVATTAVQTDISTALAVAGFVAATLLVLWLMEMVGL